MKKIYIKKKYQSCTGGRKMMRGKKIQKENKLAEKTTVRKQIIKKVRKSWRGSTGKKIKKENDVWRRTLGGKWKRKKIDKKIK